MHSRNTGKSGGTQKHQTASRGRSLCYNKQYSRSHVCGFHKFVGQEIIQGFNLTMDEWTEFLIVMESITEEVNESQPNTLHYTQHELIHLGYI